MGVEHTLKVGEWADIPAGTERRSFGRHRDISIRALYCGMPNPEVFSVAKGVHHFYGGVLANIFYPKDTKEITLTNIGVDNVEQYSFAVKKVTPETLILEYLGR